MRAAAAPIMLVGLALALAATASAAPLDTKNSVKLQSPSEVSAFERELIRRSLLQAKNYPMTKIVAKTELEEAEFGTSVAMAGAYYAAGARFEPRLVATWARSTMGPFGINGNG